MTSLAGPFPRYTEICFSGLAMINNPKSSYDYTTCALLSSRVIPDPLNLKCIILIVLPSSADPLTIPALHSWLTTTVFFQAHYDPKVTPLDSTVKVTYISTTHERAHASTCRLRPNLIVQRDFVTFAALTAEHIYPIVEHEIKD